MSSVIIINERSPISSVAKLTHVTPTQQATTTTTKKKKKKYIGGLIAVLCSGVGCFSVTRRYSVSSGTGTGGGGGLRASVAGMETWLSSSVNHPDGSCVPASGAWDGKSFSQGPYGGSTPYETCYRDDKGGECWSKSFHYKLGWFECKPYGDYKQYHSIRPGVCLGVLPGFIRIRPA